MTKDELLIAIKDWAELEEIDFSKIPEDEREEMSDSDIGFMHGRNCTIKNLLSFINELERNLTK